MSSTVFIARRFLAADRRYLFARLLSVVAIIAVAISVFAMTVVLSVMSGFRNNLEKKLLGFMPHVTITANSEAIIPAPGVSFRRKPESIDPDLRLDDIFRGGLISIVEGEAIVETSGDGGENAQGVKVIGMDRPDRHVWTSVSTTADEDVLIGNELALNLGALPGDEIRLIAPLGMVTPAGDLAPVVRSYRVGGTIRTGFYEHDSKLVVLPRNEAAQLLGEHATEKMVAYLDDPMRAGKVADDIRGSLTSLYSVTTWREQNSKLFGALRLERVVMGFLLVMMLAISSIGICGVVFMQVEWRRRDIAILSTVGAAPSQLRNIVLHLGTWIGLLGSAIGSAMALATGLWFRSHPIQLPASFYLDYLPIDLKPGTFLVIALLGILLAVAAAALPARRLRGLSVAEALRYE